MSRFLPWKIVHVAVREPLPDLYAEAGSGGLFVVFWCDSIPVGQLSIPALLLPLTSAQLAATLPRLIAPAIANRLLDSGFRAPLPVDLRKQTPPEPPDLARLLELECPLESCSRAAPSWNSGPSAKVAPCVSVVVCTRNRPEALKKCLSSIRGLLPQPGEILVVDNDPSSGLTKTVISASPEVRYVPEPRRGLSAARNAGIRNSRGAIVAFTDDDVEVHPGWVGAIQAVFRDEGIIATTGLVLPAELATPAQYAFQGDSLGWGWGYRALDFDGNFFRSMKHVGVPAWRLGAGANMAFRREAFERVGFFDERLGAGTSGCSEDSELWYRLLAEGHRCRYEPAAVVFHAHRSGWKELRDQSYNYMRGHVAALLFQFDRYGHWGNIYRAFLALPFYFITLGFRYLKRSVGRSILHSGQETPFLPLLDQISGALAGYGYYLRYRRHPADPTTREESARTPLRSATIVQKTSLSTFLSHNPFESPLTLGFFYREKMRAIYRVAPGLPFREVLEVGGGRSGLTRLLYPTARVTNLDMEPSFADAPCNRQDGVRFVCGDATRLEFASRSFDAVTMFDVLEHIPDHERAVSEALRVLRPGGYLLISTPNEHWRFPYYKFMKKWCRSEEEMFAEWGHVRRGYSIDQLNRLITIRCERSATFISPLTVLCHDVAFSRIPGRLRRAICLALSPITWIGYAIHRPCSSGTETAAAWRKPVEIS
jgi:glycosyltransferase involved in cell wall biosynthesis/SAM-dependent methyltransferase